MATIRFFGHEVPVGNNDAQDRQRAAAQGRLLNEMTAADLPGVVAHHKHMQQVNAARAKQEREEERAIGRLIAQEEARYEQG